MSESTLPDLAGGKVNEFSVLFTGDSTWTPIMQRGATKLGIEQPDGTIIDAVRHAIFGAATGKNYGAVGALKGVNPAARKRPVDNVFVRAQQKWLLFGRNAEGSITMKVLDRPFAPNRSKIPDVLADAPVLSLDLWPS